MTKHLRKYQGITPLFQSFWALFLIVSLIISPCSASAAIPQTLWPEFKSLPLTLPASLGAITQSYQGRPDKVIFYIQDAHDSLEAQQNIAALIERFVERNGVKTVLEEGYQGEVPTDAYFGTITNRAAREKAAYALMDRMLISGAEYAHAIRDKDFRLFGAEDLAGYQANLQAYKRAASYQSRAERDLNILKSVLEGLIYAHSKKKLKTWLRFKKRFDNDNIHLPHYVSFMMKRTRGEERARYPVMNRLFQFWVSHQEDKAVPFDPRDAVMLIEEVNTWQMIFIDREAEPGLEREVLHAYMSVERLQKLNAMQADPDELLEALNSLNELRTQKLAERIGNRSHKTVLLSRFWEKSIQSQRRFYDFVHARDDGIEGSLQAFLNDPSEKSAVLVLGGFHTPGITRRLKEKGISFFVITPRIISYSSRHQRYYKQLMSSARREYAALKGSSNAIRQPSVFYAIHQGFLTAEQFKTTLTGLAGSDAARNRALSITGRQELRLSLPGGKIPVVLLVGKPGSGKSYMGKRLSQALGAGALHVSMGEFIRRHTPFNTPLTPHERRVAYHKLTAFLRAKPFIPLLIFDNNPYGDDSFDELMEFLNQEEFELFKVIDIQTDDGVALARMNQRGRQNTGTHNNAQRLDHYNSQVPPQIKKFKPGLVLSVGNNASDGGAAAYEHIYHLLKHAASQKAVSFMRDLSARVSVRTGHVYSENDISSAAAEVVNRGLADFAMAMDSQMFTRYPGADPQAILRQEAKLYVYAEPMPGENGFYEANPVWVPEAFAAMNMRRERFYNRVKESDGIMGEYWEKQLPRDQGTVTEWNRNRRVSTLDASIVLVVMASRFHVVKNRLSEIQASLQAGSFDVQIVLADPQNLDREQRSHFARDVSEYDFPVKLIESKNGGSISTNRNLGTAASAGKYIIFLDDDVRLGPSTLPEILRVLKTHPEIGVTQAVTYDGPTGVMDRPKPWFSKYFYGPDVAITNLSVGMVMGVRREIAQAVPFVPFWPNFGEDVFFGNQVKDLGFLLAFVYAVGAHVVHDHVTVSSATRSSSVFTRAWIHHVLSYYLMPRYYKDLGQIEMLVRINKTASDRPEVMEETFRLLRGKVADYLEGRISIEALADGSWLDRGAGLSRAQLEVIAAYFEEHKDRILNLKISAVDADYALSTDRRVVVDFPEAQYRYGFSRGFYEEVTSSSLADKVVFQIHNAMRHNAGPKVKIHARGAARKYLEKAFLRHAHLMTKMGEALNRYYGQNAYQVLWETEARELFKQNLESESVDENHPDVAGGIHLGIDFGGRSAKIAAFVNGSVMVMGQIPGDSYSKTNSDQHFDFAQDVFTESIRLLSVQSGLSRDDIVASMKSVVLSYNAPVNGGKLITHFDNLGTDGNKKMAEILPELTRRFRSVANSLDLQVLLANDGFAGASAGQFLSREDHFTGNTAYFGIGTGLAFGFTSPQLESQTGLREVHKMQVDYDTEVAYTSGERLSTKGFLKLAGLSEDLSDREIRNFIQAADQGYDPSLRAARLMGTALAGAVRESLKYWPYERVYVGGGFAHGAFGEAMLEEATALLGRAGPVMLLPPKHFRGYESAVGAAYYGAVQRSELRSKQLIRDFLAKEISQSRNVYSESVNVHTEFAEAEVAIRQEQKRIEAQLGKWITLTDSYDEEFVISGFRDLLRELSEVVAARKKFVSLGIPAFHNHTNLEDDGRLTPEGLIQKALENNISILYVTGHNRMAGSIEAVRQIKQMDIILEIFPGVEIDTPVLGAEGIVHFVAIGPHDSGTVFKMKALGDAVFDTMQVNFKWRSKQILELADDAVFEREWSRARQRHPDLEDRLNRWKDALVKKGVFSASAGFEDFKIQLKKWFKDVAEFSKARGMREEIFNKLDVLGNWTDALESWPHPEHPLWTAGTAGSRRKAMRGFFDLLYSEKEVEDLSGAKMRRAEDILGAFASLGARITLAHPEFELFVIHEIPPARHSEFWEKMRTLVDAGILHAVGAGWSRSERGKVAAAVQTLRKNTARTEETLPLVLNIPDYHGERKEEKDIRKGMYHSLVTGGGYYVWEDIGAHDVDNFFRDAEHMSAPSFHAAKEALAKGNVRESLEKIMEAYENNPYIVDRAIELLKPRSELRFHDAGERGFVQNNKKIENRLNAADGDLWLRSLHGEYLLMISMRDFEQLNVLQRTEFDVVLRQNKHIQIIFYGNDFKLINEDAAGQVRDLKRDLGARRIFITDLNVSEAVSARALPGRKIIHFSGPQTGIRADELLKKVPDPLKKNFYSWRYSGIESGVLMASLYWAESGKTVPGGGFLDLSMISQSLRNHIREYLSNILIATSA